MICFRDICFISALTGLLPLSACDGGGDAAAAATLVLGTGEFSYEGVQDGQMLTIVHGPQGGYHIWLGLRAENFDPDRVQIDFSMVFVDGNKAFGSPITFPAQLFDGPSGDLEFAGIQAELEPRKTRGKLIRITLSVTDEDGETASDSMDVVPIGP